MNNKEVVKKIKEEFNYTYYFVDVFSEDCTIDSLVRLDSNFKCKECVLLDTITTVRVFCPLIMSRETRMLK